MVPDTSALTVCCGESARVPVRFLSAFHAFRHVPMTPRSAGGKKKVNYGLEKTEGEVGIIVQSQK